MGWPTGSPRAIPAIRWRGWRSPPAPSPTANIRRARAQIAAGDAGKARDVTSLLLTAWAYAGAGDLRRALESVDQISDPNVAVFRDYHAALIADALGDPAEALRRYKLAYAKDLQTLQAGRRLRAIPRAAERRRRRQEGLRGFLREDSRPSRGESRAGGDRLRPPVTPVVRNAKEGAAEALYGLGGAGTRQGDELASLIYLQARAGAAARPRFRGRQRRQSACPT